MGCGGHRCIKYVDEMWRKAYNDHGQLMRDLLDDFKQAATFDLDRRSLLKEFRCSDDICRKILKALTGGTVNQYTPKVSSLFLHYFDTALRTTKSQSGKFGTKFVRLGTIDNENTEDGYDADQHDVERSFMCEKALQLVLLFNNLLGIEILYLTASSPNFCKCNDETKLMALIYEPFQDCIKSLFSFLKTIKSGLRIRIGEYNLPDGAGRPDLAVSVCHVDKSSGKIKSSKCVSVLEFKRANSGFWLAWQLLTGKGWTEQEREAFFALRDLPSDEDTKDDLEKWQTDAAWQSAEDVLDEVGMSRVEIRYLAKVASNPQNSGPSENPALNTPTESSDEPPAKLRTIEEQTESSDNADGSDNAGGSENKTATGQNWPSSYYTRAGSNNNIGDITAKLDGARFRVSFDDCLKAVGKATEHAVLSSCSRIAIADGLTIIAGSLNEVTVSEGDGNPTDDEDVIDINFYKTYTIQSHEPESSLKLTNYLCNGMFFDPDFRDVGYKLLSLAEKYDGKVTPESQNELKRLMKDQTFQFGNQEHGANNPGLQRSFDIYIRERRAAVVAALADFDKNYPELKKMTRQSTSDAFIISEYFRENVHEGVESGEPLNGRSLSVAKVQRRGDNENYFVLKQYSGDKESVERMARELEAYRRVSQLSLSDRKRHVVELVSFGALDLDEGIPRLYLLLEYVEGTENFGLVETSAQLLKVDDLLLSVGVSHNDLDERNYNWQLHLDGRWYIKVFDFDHATFKQMPKSERRHVRDRTTDTQLPC